MKKYYWTMKNGNKIDVDDMTESHLRNTLKMIIRNREEADTIESMDGAITGFPVDISQI